MQKENKSNLLSNGGYGCVYYPSISCKGKQNISKKYVTKIQRNDTSAENEMRISNILSDTLYYNKHFVPVTKSCGIDITQLSANLKTKCDIFQKKSDTYILMDMPYVNGLTLNEHLIQNKDSKNVMNTILSCYDYLLTSIQILIDNNIVHYDLKGNNIMFNIDKNIPLIIDFGMSIDLEDVHKDLEFYFFTYAPSYYYWCPEIHFINYIIHSKKYKSLTLKDVDTVSHEILKHNNAIIHNMSQEFIDTYIKSMQTYYYTFVNKNAYDVIQQLLDNADTWDNYSLSIIFLKIIHSIYPDGYIKNSFISYFSQLLLLNIHPNPKKRLSIHTTKDRLNGILLNTKIDSFVDVLDSLKLHRHKFNTSLKKTENQSVKMSEHIQSKRET